MTLQDWLNEGRLAAHTSSRQEITRLLALYGRDVADAQIKNLSVDRRFAIAYHAALMLSIAALAASG